MTAEFGEGGVEYEASESKSAEKGKLVGELKEAEFGVEQRSVAFSETATANVERLL